MPVTGNNKSIEATNGLKIKYDSKQSIFRGFKGPHLESGLTVTITASFSGENDLKWNMYIYHKELIWARVCMMLLIWSYMVL